MINVSLEFIADVLGTSAESVTEAIKDGENFKPQNEIEAFIRKGIDDKMFESRRDIKEQQYSRGKKEALQLKEREVREKFDLQGSTFDEMISELLEKSKVKPDMTPEAVRNTEIYKIDMGKFKTQLKEIGDDRDKTVSTYRRKEIDFRIRQKANELMKKHRFQMPDQVLDQNIWEDVLLSRLDDNDHKISIDDKGELVVLDAEGNQKTDDRTVEPITFEQRFVSVAKPIFKVAKSDDRDSPGNHTDKDINDTPNDDGFAPIESDEKYMEILGSMKDADKRRRYMEFYEAQKAVNA